jgi:hypothetical protein
MQHEQLPLYPRNSLHHSTPRPARLLINNALKGRPFSAAEFWKAGAIGMTDITV